MKTSQLRSKMSEQLLERRKESAATNEGGGKFGTIIKKDSGATEWWCKEGEHIIDIIPYIAGEGNPETKIRKGDISDHATYYVHKNVGAGDLAFVCPTMNYGDPCPICEHSKKLKEEGEPDEVWKAIRPKRMTVYNIIVYDDTKEEKKGVQVWVIAHWNMERHLNILANKPRGGGKVLFSHPDEGKSVSFQRKGAGMNNTQYLGHKFEDRDYTIPDEILDSAFCLEEIVHIPDYDEIALAYWGNKAKKTVETVNEETGEVDEKPTRTRLREKPKTKTKPDCFGFETDQHEDCLECDYYEACMNEKENNLDKEEVGGTEEPEEEKPVTKPIGRLRGRMGR